MAPSASSSCCHRPSSPSSSSRCSSSCCPRHPSCCCCSRCHCLHAVAHARGRHRHSFVHGCRHRRAHRCTCRARPSPSSLSCTPLCLQAWPPSSLSTCHARCCTCSPVAAAAAIVVVGRSARHWPCVLNKKREKKPLGRTVHTAALAWHGCHRCHRACHCSCMARPSSLSGGVHAVLNKKREEKNTGMHRAGCCSRTARPSSALLLWLHVIALAWHGHRHCQAEGMPLALRVKQEMRKKNIGTHRARCCSRTARPLSSLSSLSRMPLHLQGAAVIVVQPSLQPSAAAAVVAVVVAVALAWRPCRRARDCSCMARLSASSVSCTRTRLLLQAQPSSCTVHTGAHRCCCMRGCCRARGTAVVVVVHVKVCSCMAQPVRFEVRVSPNPEPDPFFGSMKSGSKFGQFPEPNLKFGSRFGNFWHEPDRTGPRQH